MGCFVDCSTVSFTGWEELVTSWSYCFSYCLLDRVFDVEGVPISAAKVNSYSAELIKEATFFSVSLVEIPITLLEDALALSLDFLCVKVVYCWLSMMSGWTHDISPWGVGTGTRPFSFLLRGSILITLSSPLRMGTTLAVTYRNSLPNWRDVMLDITLFCSGRSLRTSASIRSWRTSLKM